LIGDWSGVRSLISIGLSQFIFGPPEIEEKAWKKVKDIIEFASKYKPLGDSDSDD
jgi:hypothetical protein